MGDPVMHSRSPAIFAYWFGKYGLAGSYLPLAIKPAGLRAALRALPALGFSGTNLTIPHKEAALAIVDRVDPVAQRIGAMNCVVVAPDGTLAGFNYDAFGYIASVREAQPGWRADTGPIVVLGAGGSARAVVVGLVDEGARDIRVVNRTLARAQALARDLGEAVKAVPWDERHAAHGGRRHADQHHKPGHGRPAAARSRARYACPRARSSPTSSTSRAKHRSSPPRGRAAIRPSTGSACCSIRRGPPSRPGSASCRRPRRSCAQ